MKKIFFNCVLAVLLIFTLPAVSFAAETKNISYNADEIFSKCEECCFYVKAYNKDGTVKNYGSGYFISDNGLALTANHVINGAAKINVMFADKSTMTDVPVVFSEYESDIAVLKIGVSGVKYLSIEQSDIKHGERIFAIGYPFRESKIITDGIVATPEMKLNENQRMLMTVPLINGMSGGPIINQKGNAIGIASGSVITMPGLYISPPTKQIINKIKSITKEEIK